MIIYDIILLLLIIALLWWFFSFIVIPSIVNFFKQKNYKIHRVMLSNHRASHPPLFEIIQYSNFGPIRKSHVFPEKYDTKEKAQKFIDKQIKNEMIKNKVEIKERITKHVFLENSLNTKKKKKWWKLF